MQKIGRLWGRLASLLTQPLLENGIFLLTMVVLALVVMLCVGLPRSEQAKFFLHFLIDLYGLACLLCCLPRRWARGVKGFLLLVAYALSMIEVYLFLRFRLTFSPMMLNLLMETNGGETREFLWGVWRSPELWKTLVIFLPLLLGMLVLDFLKRKRPWERLRFGAIGMRKSVAAWWGFVRLVVLPLLLGAMCVLGVRTWLEEKQQMTRYFLNQATRQAEGVSQRIFHTPYYRLLHAAHFLHIARGETNQLIARMQQLQVDSCAATCPNIVLIIGESYNKHHASLYGYTLPTTPHLSRLERQGTLLKFTDVISPWNVTSQAFKSFLSTQSADEGGSWTDGVLFPAVFRKAGYRVCWITNQFYHSASQGVIDFNGSFFLNDQRMDSLCFDYRNLRRSRGDSTILQLLSGHVPAEKNLYMLHLYGQHMEYEQRYPKGKTRFREADIDRPDLKPRERRIVAHYDNATWHNDECVARILNHFRKDDAIVLYFADHGEEVFDGTAGRYGRNHTPTPDAPTLKAEYEVPFMVWTTARFRRKHPSLWRALKRAQHRPFSTDDLPHLLFGLAGISTPYYAAERDLFSSQFVSHRRWVKETVDYDTVIRQKEKPHSTETVPSLHQ